VVHSGCGFPLELEVGSPKSIGVVDMVPERGKSKKRKKSSQQQELVFDEGAGLSTQEQQYDPTSIINEVRGQVDRWRSIPNPSEW